MANRSISMVQQTECDPAAVLMTSATGAKRSPATTQALRAFTVPGALVWWSRGHRLEVEVLELASPADLDARALLETRRDGTSGSMCRSVDHDGGV